MYSIILADDNQKICDGLKILIEQSFPDFKIIGTFFDGKSVLNAIQKQLPDIIITDISMPGADGLEICRRIRERSAMTQIILISGYKEFEYAKRAIDYNVLKFLIKPYSTELLTESIHEAITALNVQVNLTQESTKIYLTKRIHLKQCVSDVFYGKENGSNLKDCLMQNFTTPAEACTVCETRIFPEPLPAFLSELEFDSFHLSSFFMKDNCLVLFFKEEYYKDNYLTDCRKSAEMLGLSLAFNTTAEMSFQNWCRFCTVRKLAVAFVAALKSLNVNGYIQTYRTELENLSPLTDFFQITSALLADKRLPTFQINPKESTSSSILRFFDAYLSLTDILSLKIKHYIEKNYTNPNLSVSQIAEHFKMTSNYISGCFKLEAGMSIREFINNIRIEQAKRLLLQEANATNENIATLVGYSSLTYFQYIFKSKLHLTPQQFRRKMGLS